MAQFTKAALGTGAITGGNQVAFTLPSKYFKNQSRIHLMAEGLAGAETVTLWVLAGDEWCELMSDHGSGAGAGSQIAFSATHPVVSIDAPGIFGVTKTASTGAVNIIVDDGR